MKKSIIALALFVALTLPAAAQMAAGGGESAVYIGKDERLYSAGGDPLADGTASGVVYAGTDVLIYERADERGCALMRLSRGPDGAPVEIARIEPGAAYVPDDGAVYYVDAEDCAKLMAYDTATGATGTAVTAASDIGGLRASIDGLLVDVGGAEKLFAAQAEQLIEPLAPADGCALANDGMFETALDTNGQLSLRGRGAGEWTSVATDVLASWIGEGHVYYLQRLGSGARAMYYDLETAASGRLEYFSESMMPAIAAVSGRVFVMSAAGAVYELGVDGTQAPVELIRIEEETDARLFVAGGILVVYDASDPARLRYVASYPIQPAVARDEYAELARGDRNDDVRRLQEALRELGYLKGTADGVFGTATERALLYLQFDMGLTETGKADAALQRALYEGSAPKFQTYVSLKRGDRGIRVRELQERLRALCYTKYKVDGAYGSETAEAVERFQAQIGNKRNGGTITEKQLSDLFKKSASECNTYFELKQGDEAPVVLRLNKRLKKLGFLTGTASETYSQKTAKAVRGFQEQAGLKATGIANARTQQKLFAKDAPTPEPTPEPTPPPPGVQVVGSSAITTLRNWLKNNLGLDYKKKEAVAYLQDRLIQLGYMNAGQGTQVYDNDTKNAVAAFQKANGIKANGIVNKKTLKALFG